MSRVRMSSPQVQDVRIEFAGHQHRLPCPDDEPLFYRYADGCTVERVPDDGSMILTPQSDLAKDDQAA